MNVVLRLVLIVCVSGVGAREVRSATLRVPSQYSTIQDAINAAVTGDSVLVAPGVYREAVDFVGKAITVASAFFETGNPASISTTIISPPSNLSGVSASSGEGTNARLVGFTITGCSGLNSAAIRCYQGSLSIFNCRLISNQCRGIIMYQSRSLLRGNEIHGNPSFVGGGPHNPIHCAQSGPTMEGNTIFATDPNGNLRAIYHSTTGPATDLRTTIRSNTIFGILDGEFHQGGPLHLISQNLFIVENGFSSAVGITGADEGLRIVNNTLIGGGFSVQLGASPQFKNNIVAFSRRGVDVLSGAPVIAYNDLWQCSERYNGLPDQTGTNGNVSVEPGFVDVPGRDFNLRADSAAIDAGDPTAVPDPDGTRPDLGAFFFDQSYQGWIRRNFLKAILNDTNAQETVWGYKADPDNDRAPNLLEYFSGSNPLSADSHLHRLNLQISPASSLLTYRRSKRIARVTHELQGSDVLPNWMPADASEVPLTDLGDARLIQGTVPNAGRSHQYFRLRIIPLP